MKDQTPIGNRGRISPAELGRKRECPQCNARFYDFGKEELECPKCDALIDISVLALKPVLIAPEKRDCAPQVVQSDEEEPEEDAEDTKAEVLHQPVFDSDDVGEDDEDEDETYLEEFDATVDDDDEK